MKANPSLGISIGSSNNFSSDSYPSSLTKDDVTEKFWSQFLIHLCFLLLEIP